MTIRQIARKIYRRLIEEHDFLYYMTDDRRLYEAGLQEQREIMWYGRYDSVIINLYNRRKTTMLKKANIKPVNHGKERAEGSGNAL